MSEILCRDWNDDLGICEKHCIPQIPCTKCIEEHNPNMTVYLYPEDCDKIGDPGFRSIMSLFPKETKGHQYWFLDHVHIVL